MWGSLFSRDASQSLVFYIGSARVAGAMVTEGDDGRTCLQHYARRELPRQETQSRTAHLSQLRECTTAVCTELLEGIREGGHSTDIHAVHAVIGAPWYRAHVQEVSQHQEQDGETLTVTDELLKELVNTIDRPALQKDDAGNDIEDFEPLEQTACHVTLNGYVIDNPIGQEVKSLVCHGYVSIVSSRILETVREGIGQVWSGHDITFHSFALAATHIIGEMRDVPRSVTLCQIGTEVTELASIREASCLSVHDYPHGVNNAIRRIAAEEQQSNATASDTFAQYVAGDLGEHKRQRTRAALQEERDAWESAVCEFCRAQQNGVPISPNIVLLAPRAYRTWYHNILETMDLSEYTTAGTEVSVHALTGADLLRYCSGDGASDPSAMIAARFVHTYQHGIVVAPHRK